MAEKTSPPEQKISRAETEKPGTQDNPASLSYVVHQMKNWVERCGWVWVEAQVIEYRRRAGYIQFLTLRDTESEVSSTVTCTKIVADAADGLVEGATVLARLHPNIYAPTARFSFECDQILISGEGQLLLRLEQLKRKLQAEGLFSPDLKRPLPLLPKGIGLITGAGSAAERDVKTNILARWAAANIITKHTLVQGDKAAGEIIAALAELDANREVDVIILARGGGSLEDLLPFSDESLVRAVAQAKTPVISAIGHEPDTPLVDWVADLRASTPTDAAKKVVPDAEGEYLGIADAKRRIIQAVLTSITGEKTWLAAMLERPVMKNPLAAVEIQQQWLRDTRSQLKNQVIKKIEFESAEINHQLRTIRAMSPRSTLQRGYTILASDTGHQISSITQLEKGQQLTAYLGDGQALLGVLDSNLETEND